MGNYSGKKNRVGSVIGTGAIVVFLFVMFIYAVIWFRKPKSDAYERINSIADVMTPDPISRAVINGAIDTESKTAGLMLMATGEGVGAARRGTKDKRYFIEMSALLPEVDREEFFYQGWLLRKIPYDYFSIGELITNDEGEFVIEWQAENPDDNFDTYTQIVITLQKYEGVTDPQVHIVEGEFGE